MYVCMYVCIYVCTYVRMHEPFDFTIYMNVWLEHPVMSLCSQRFMAITMCMYICMYVMMTLVLSMHRRVTLVRLHMCCVFMSNRNSQDAASKSSSTAYMQSECVRVLSWELVILVNTPATHRHTCTHTDTHTDTDTHTLGYSREHTHTHTHTHTNINTRIYTHTYMKIGRDCKKVRAWERIQISRVEIKLRCIY
jgi:hypothetical protein